MAHVRWILVGQPISRGWSVNVPKEVSQNVQRAADSLASAVEHVGVAHRGLDALVAEDLLLGPMS
jgi:hypothetical protein